MGRTYRYERGWGKKSTKKGSKSKKITSSPQREVPKPQTEEFWDDPKMWENEDFEKFTKKR